MPILTLSSKQALSSSQKRKLGKQLTALSTKYLSKIAEVTVVRFFDNTFFYDGSGASSDGQFALEIKITRGTNNKLQIATFQREAHNVLVSALDSSDSINYIAVEEVPAANWGFEGLTQEARFHS